MDATLRSIFQLGEKMQQALASDDLDTFYLLVDQREKLVGQLSNAAQHDESFQISEKDSQVLEEQFELIIAALNAKEQSMMNQLQTIDQFRKAGKSYFNTKKRPQLIKGHLLG